MDLESTVQPKISLRAARVNVGLSQSEAAQKIGISKATLQNYENGRTIPNWNRVDKISEIYDYPASLIFLSLNSL